MKDYYKTLGVAKTATPEEIKKAFKELARQYHPDRNPGDNEAEEKFKELNEAYAVLSNPQKRQEYDTFGSQGFHQRYSKEDIFRGFDFGGLGDLFGGLGNDLFSKIFGGAQGGGFRGGSSGFGGFQDQGFGGFGQGQARGQDLETRIVIGLEEAASGGRRRLNLQGADGTRQEIEVMIPKGVEAGQKLRVQGKGGSSPYGTPGDLLITVDIAPHPLFTVQDRDLQVQVKVPVTTLLLGGSVNVPVLNDGVRQLKVKAGTPNQAKMRIREMGMPDRKGNRGDLYVELSADLPATLSSEQEELVKQLRETGL